jgi:hypothetical protein
MRRRNLRYRGSVRIIFYFLDADACFGNHPDFIEAEEKERERGERERELTGHLVYSPIRTGRKCLPAILSPLCVLHQ